MVKRAKVPRDQNNRIMAGGLSHRELYGWPDGVGYSTSSRKAKQRKKRKKKPQEPINVETLPKFIPEALVIGTPL